MKKILLIDDRKERQTKFTADTGIDLESYIDILDNITGEEYYTYVDKLSQDNFELEHDIIMVHRSAFGETNINILDRLKNYCKDKDKKLIFFSGGISSTFYMREPFEILLINSKIFYSSNLKIFLDDAIKNDFNILKIGYGDKWKLNVMLNTLEKINKFLGYNHAEDIVYYDEFSEETQITLLNDFIEYKKPEIKNGGVKMTDLVKLSTNITNKIKQEVVLNV